MDVAATPSAGYSLFPGGSVPGSVTLTPGGVGRNVAVALAGLLPLPPPPRVRIVSVVGSDAAGDALVNAYNATRYHQPSGAFMPDWTFAGTAQEASVAYLVGRKLADGTDWPLWNAGNEYAPLRAAGPK